MLPEVFFTSATSSGAWPAFTKSPSSSRCTGMPAGAPWRWTQAASSVFQGAPSGVGVRAGETNTRLPPAPSSTATARMSWPVAAWTTA
ncbi:MAG: hypothetical protein EOO71_02085 [Myxococcaceae bacterium]|nr:MAG: hypothetical protein EOO71_02085 [Myxococcaceae bacterium]